MYICVYVLYTYKLLQFEPLLSNPRIHLVHSSLPSIFSPSQTLEVGMPPATAKLLASQDARCEQALPSRAEWKPWEALLNLNRFNWSGLKGCLVVPEAFPPGASRRSCWMEETGSRLHSKKITVYRPGQFGRIWEYINWLKRSVCAHNSSKEDYKHG